jgi:hypothetical protein
LSVYRFVLRQNGQLEELGTIPLPDDREAIAFGKSVAREMAENDPAPYAGAIMVVIEGERAVASIRPSKAGSAA